jgi:hypothetical protein
MAAVLSGVAAGAGAVAGLWQRLQGGRERRPAGPGGVVAAQGGQLGPGAVVAHAHVVDDPLGRLLAPPQLLLGGVAAVDLVVGELPAGERRPVRGVGLQVGGPRDAVPEPAAARPDQGRDRVRVELGVEQELDVVQVVAEEVPVAQQVLDQRDPRPLAARVPPAVVGGAGRQSTRSLSCQRVSKKSMPKLLS